MLQISRSFLSSTAYSPEVGLRPVQTRRPKLEKAERAYLVAAGGRFGAGASRRRFWRRPRRYSSPSRPNHYPGQFLWVFSSDTNAFTVI